MVRTKMTEENVEETKNLKCPNKKCGYEWEYKGTAPFYTSCPRCKSSVKVNGVKK
jgi:predicted Zn-ribbon and HTH transcriptional regulator